MKKEIAGFILVALALAWTGCQNSSTSPSAPNTPASSSTTSNVRLPTEEDGAQVWRNMKNALGDPKDLVSFKKTDGALDGNIYTLYGEAATRFNGKTEKYPIEYKFTRTEKGWRGPDNHTY